MVVQEPEGHTTCSALRKTSKKRSAQGRASSQYPELKAGWPQQVWSSGKLTSQPMRRRTVTVSMATSGCSWSTKHGTKSETLRAMKCRDSNTICDWNDFRLRRSDRQAWRGGAGLQACGKAAKETGFSR